MKFIFKILLLVIQTGGVVLILLLSEIDNETCWILPCILLLCSLRWWPNYVTGKSDIGMNHWYQKSKKNIFNDNDFFKDSLDISTVLKKD